MRRFRVCRLPIGVLVSLLTVAALGGSAHAALLTGSATSCAASSESQVFLPWQDSADYGLVPGGAFESGEAAWSLSGGAATVPGNESFGVHGADDVTSLSLPSGSSASSPSFCVGVQNPTVRLFAENSGDPSSTLAVDVNFIGPLGLPLSLPIAWLSSGASWEPTPVLPIVVNLLTLLPGNETPVSLTFAPQGTGGSWQIDDVYVDPMHRGG
jgi:hypothetical protein